MKAQTLIFLTLALLCSCSIKEDRSQCPVYVTLNLDKFVDKGFNEGGVIFDIGGERFRNNLSFLPIMGEGITRACSRVNSGVAVVSGINNSIYNNGILSVPLGSEADPIWTYGEVFEIASDNYLIEAEPYKQYCKIKFNILSIADLNEYPWRFKIKAECNGFDLLRSKAVEGKFETVVHPNTLNEWYVILPRQKDSKISLEIFLPSKSLSNEGIVENTIDLAALFEQNAYNWNAESLDDIIINLDYTRGNLEVSIEEWDNDNSFLNEQI